MEGGPCLGLSFWILWEGPREDERFQAEETSQTSADEIDASGRSSCREGEGARGCGAPQSRGRRHESSQLWLLASSLDALLGQDEKKKPSQSKEAIRKRKKRAADRIRELKRKRRSRPHHPLASMQGGHAGWTGCGHHIFQESGHPHRTTFSYGRTKII